MRGESLIAKAVRAALSRQAAAKLVIAVVIMVG